MKQKLIELRKRMWMDQQHASLAADEMSPEHHAACVGTNLFIAPSAWNNVVRGLTGFLLCIKCHSWLTSVTASQLAWYWKKKLCVQVKLTLDFQESFYEDRPRSSWCILACVRHASTQGRRNTGRSGQWRSQPKNLGGKNFWGGQNLWL